MQTFTKKRQRQALEYGEFWRDQSAFQSSASWLSLAERDGLRASLYEEHLALRGLKALAAALRRAPTGRAITQVRAPEVS